MMYLIVMFTFAFMFMVLMLYCGISLISNFVFGVKEQKWCVLIALILCGLVWMPSFVAVCDISNENHNVVNVEVNTTTISERYGIPEPYYSDVEERGKNISELRIALKEIKHLQKYEVNVYDCSEMSAYTEWHLENQGFNATILSNGEHAWVVVYNLIDNAPVNVECTRVPPGITNNRNYTRSYDGIYAACSRSTNTSCPAWNWWREICPQTEQKQGGNR